mgnify:CR=1 FL=1
MNKTKKKNRKKKKLSFKKNILGEKIKICSLNPMTGYYRNGYCMTGREDTGTHTVCATMDKEFLDFTKSKGNNLYSVVKPGDNWCLCEYRWNEALKNKKAPKVILDATNMRTDSIIRKNIIIHSKILKKIAYFAGGCFWGMEKKFKSLIGVIDTDVGYMGGYKKYPSYKEVCSGKTGHAETVKVIYNSNIISFEELISNFFKFHDPTTLNKQGLNIGLQYRSIAFYSNKKEKLIIDKFLSNSKKIVTRAERKSKFYKAEEYHQNYYK